MPRFFFALCSHYYAFASPPTLLFFLVFRVRQTPLVFTNSFAFSTRQHLVGLSSSGFSPLGTFPTPLSSIFLSFLSTLVLKRYRDELGAFHVTFSVFFFCFRTSHKHIFVLFSFRQENVDAPFSLIALFPALSHPQLALAPFFFFSPQLPPRQSVFPFSLPLIFQPPGNESAGLFRKFY